MQALPMAAHSISRAALGLSLSATNEAHSKRGTLYLYLYAPSCPR